MVWALILGFFLRLEITEWQQSNRFYQKSFIYSQINSFNFMFKYFVWPPHPGWPDVPHWKVLSRNTQALNAGRICPAFQWYFKLLTNNQNNYLKEKNIFEYFLELFVLHIKLISKVLVVSLILLRYLLLLNTCRILCLRLILFVLIQKIEKIDKPLRDLKIHLSVFIYCQTSYLTLLWIYICYYCEK
jgi:hypothetical protein